MLRISHLCNNVLDSYSILQFSPVTTSPILKEARLPDPVTDDGAEIEENEGGDEELSDSVQSLLSEVLDPETTLEMTEGQPDGPPLQVNLAQFEPLETSFVQQGGQQDL